MSAPFPPPLREAARLAALYRYEILDSPPEKELDDLVHLASYICNTPISLISLVDSDRQWFKSKVGLTATQTSRIIAFCAHAILDDNLLIVPDALADERFKNNPLVTGDPHVRFYCGAPLITPDRYRIGVLNVIDHAPRELSEEQLEAIRVLSRQVMDHLTMDRQHRELIQAVNKRTHAEETLKRNEEKFRALSETTSSGIFISGEDRLLYTNPAASTITGYRPDELLTMTLWDLVHPSFQEQVQARVRAIQQTNDVPVRFEFQIVRKDGEISWVNYTDAFIEFDGQPARIGTASDITKRKQAQDAVQAREQHLRDVLNSLFAFVGILALDGTVIEVNQAPLEMAGLSASDVLGKRVWDCFWVNYDSAVQADMRAACERGARGEFSRYDVAIRMAGDWLMTIDFMLAPLRNTSGEIAYLIPSGVDITERKKAEEALRRSEERFRLVALATNDVLWDWDIMTNEYWWSPNARKNFGYDANAEPSIEAWTSRLYPDDRETVLKTLEEAMAGHIESWSGEYRFRLGDGAYGHFLDRGRIVRDEAGKPIRMIGAMTDVTGSKRAYASVKEAYAKLQAMSREVLVSEEKERRRLSRELHDEFGQLLSALMFDLNDIREGLLNIRSPKVTALRRKIKSATGTVDRLFVSFREVLAALRPATLEVLGLIPSIQAVADELQGRTGILCRVVTNRDDIRALCGADVENTIYRMAQELLMNVVRHAGATAATVTLECAGGCVSLTVQDDGVGFAAHRRPQEDRFGLPGIQERAEILGGSVSIRSEPGTGTDVTVRLPYASPAASRGTVLATRKAKPPTNRKRRKHGEKR